MLFSGLGFLGFLSVSISGDNLTRKSDLKGFSSRSRISAGTWQCEVAHFQEVEHRVPDLLTDSSASLDGGLSSMGQSKCGAIEVYESKCLRVLWASRVGIPLIRINRICGAHARHSSIPFPSLAPSALPFNGYRVTQRDSKGAREKHRRPNGGFASALPRMPAAGSLKALLPWQKSRLATRSRTSLPPFLPLGSRPCEGGESVTK